MCSTNKNNITVFFSALLIGGSLSLNVRADLTTGLVAYYPIDGNAKDSSGNNNDCQVNGASIIQNRLGKPDSAYAFNGSNNYLNCGNSTNLDITQSITLSAWVKHRTGTPSSWEDMFMKGNTSYGFQFYATQGFFTFHLTSNGWRNLSANIKPTAGQWYHIVGTYDGSTQKIYVDGKLNNTSAWAGKIESHPNDPLTVGYKVASDNSYFNGELDEIRIYNRTLSESDVQTLYQGKASCKSTGSATYSNGILSIPCVDAGSLGIYEDVEVVIQKVNKASLVN